MRFWTVGHLHDEVMRVATLTKSGAEVLSLYQMSQTRATHFRITTRGPAMREIGCLSQIRAKGTSQRRLREIEAGADIVGKVLECI